MANSLIEQKQAEVTELIGRQAHYVQNLEEKTKAQYLQIEERMVKELEEQKARHDAELEAVKSELRSMKMERAGGEEKAMETFATALNGFVRKAAGRGVVTSEHKSAMESMEHKGYVLSNGPQAGYLSVGPTIAANIIDTNLREITDVRKYADVESISGDHWHGRMKTANGGAANVAETGTRSADTTLAWGIGKIQVNIDYYETEFSQLMLDDSAYDIGSILMNESSLAFDANEGTQFITGNSVSQAEGVLTNATVLANYVLQGEASTITNGDALIELAYAIKSPYRSAGRCAYAMRRATIPRLLKLTDSQGQYIFGRLSESPMGTIMGFPIIEMPDMPAIGAGAYPILFGDWRGYKVIDKMTNWGLIIDPYTSTTGMVKYKFTRYFGGGVVIPEAFAVLKVAAS